MKVSIIVVILILLLSSCAERQKLTFEPIVLAESQCTDCPEITITVPFAKGNSKTDRTINETIEKEIVKLLLFQDNDEVQGLDKALTSFNASYAELKNRFDQAQKPWEVKIKGDLVFEDKKLLTIEVNSYLFTGGAHGYSAKTFLNFDKKKGIALKNWQLFESQRAFKKFAETKFREQEAIPATASINYTGLMFEKDSFHLPQNIGFTSEGLKLLYNPYEVASYGDGQIVLTLPFDEIEGFLADNTKS